jgi:hypothetical protein
MSRSRVPTSISCECGSSEFLRPTRSSRDAALSRNLLGDDMVESSVVVAAFGGPDRAMSPVWLSRIPAALRHGLA